MVNNISLILCIVDLQKEDLGREPLSPNTAIYSNGN